ncbi:hypothetical protein FQN51_000657 [Onygenales sp. PD_10]|nr:hypothetical protein FQN51_000657 [Onygenales sp. PD_10]
MDCCTIADAKLVGGFRLLISEQEYYKPPSYSISRELYLRIEEAFHLPQATLEGLSNEHGIFSHYEEYEDNDPGKLRRIAFLIRAPQKYQVANYGLAVSYDFKTRFATGILHGTGVVQGGDDFHLWQKCPSAELLELIKEIPDLSAEPLFLPTLLLQHHLHRARHFCTIQLVEEYDAIQRRLGMSRAGRLRRMGPYRDPVGEGTIAETRVNLRNLTGEMSTFMTETIMYCQISEWHLEYLDFLSRARNIVTTSRSGGSMAHTDEDRAINESIAFLDSVAKGLKRHNAASKERAQADFNVLYSIIAQLDNRLNAKMSASSSRDSMAMKTLAFITAIFLPGTFVATIFSMDMFTWQGSGSESGSESEKSPSNGRMVSPDFWVYWVVSIPLTVMVIVGWRVWWNWEKKNFDEDVRTEIENIEEPMRWHEAKEAPLGRAGKATWLRKRRDGIRPGKEV